VREAARRNVDMRHFDVQLIGGTVLFEGKIAEMATGEGKTLVATLAVYLVHLTGRRVHIVTVNDYLAKRDAEWMAPVYEALGLTVGAIQADMDTAGDERRAQYACDVTYGTNNEFGFDYLRDNMKTSLAQMVQGELQYAIIDEVDSILVDEARTPLIISGPAHDDVSIYSKADRVARQLLSLQSSYASLEKQIAAAERQAANARGELDEAKKAKDGKRAPPRRSWRRRSSITRSSWRRRAFSSPTRATSGRSRFSSRWGRSSRFTSTRIPIRGGAIGSSRACGPTWCFRRRRTTRCSTAKW